MLEFRLIEYPIFNLADSFIVTDMIMVMIHMIISTRRDKKEELKEMNKYVRFSKRRPL
ncbi:MULTISPECIES: signal peptidase II [Paenibacillus]|uniref:signal peptidase II n=1 Tax=Paenibacillus TaxID=44249 RepID=UPI000FD67788